MAKKPVSKKKTSTKASASSSDNVVRIKAGSSTPTKENVVKTEAATVATVEKAKTPKVKTNRSKNAFVRFFGAIGGYFKGAWVELRLVRWPTRRATWGLTGAVLLYSAFFVVLVLLLDAGFKYLFQLILGK